MRINSLDNRSGNQLKVSLLKDEKVNLLGLYTFLIIYIYSKTLFYIAFDGRKIYKYMYRKCVVAEWKALQNKAQKM